MIFLVDRSGSMGGASDAGSNISQAKKALQLFFRSLPEDCYINVVGFGSRYEFLWPESVKYGGETLAKASRHIEGLKADLGGTEIAAPLRALLDKALRPEYDRQVFILTDGQVSNIEETVSTVQKAVALAPTTRVFALGLGSGASHDLVESIAKAGGGTAAFSVSNNDLQGKVIGQLKHAIQPAFTDVSIVWEGATGAPPPYGSGDGSVVKKTIGSLLGFRKKSKPKNPASTDGFARAPFITPPVFSADRFLSYVMVNSGGRPPVAVTVTAKTPVGNLDVRLPVTEADVIEGSLLHTMAARALIHDLQIGRSWMHDAQKGDISPEDVKSEIIRLGTTFSLASKHTSFVAVQKSMELHQLDPVIGDIQSLAPSAPASFAAGMGRGGGGGGGRGRGGGGGVGAASRRENGGLQSKSKGKKAKKGAAKPERLSAIEQPKLSDQKMSSRRRGSRNSKPTAEISSEFNLAPPPPPSAPSAPSAPPPPASAPMPMGGPASFGGLQPPPPPFAPAKASSMSMSMSASSPSSAAPCPIVDNLDDNFAENSTVGFDFLAAPESRKAEEEEADFEESFEDEKCAEVVLADFLTEEKESCASLQSSDDESDDDAGEDLAEEPQQKQQQQRQDVAEGVAPTLRPEEALQQLVALQDFSGMFDLSAALAAVVGVDLDQLNPLVDAGNSAISRQLVATAVAIAFFRFKLTDLEEQWELVAAKSLKWLTKEAKKQGISVDEIVEAATALFC